MAGAGYKLFATGDVLTAAQVNTYLMQQTVMVFASSAARTTALSGVLAEGMVSYLQDTNTLEVYDGAAWVGATGDITGLTAGTGISISSATGPVPTVTNSMATEITAKGDLIVGTGSGTFDNLAAGSNGETLVADSSTSTGLRYQPTMAAGKNGIINGGMDIWQRSTSNASFAVASSGSYVTADRWNIGSSASVNLASSRQAADTVGTSYALRYGRVSGQTATGIVRASNVLESISSTTFTTNTSITLSFNAKKGADAPSTLTCYVYWGFGTDQTATQIYSGWTSAGFNSQANTVTTSSQKFSFSTAVPANATQVAVLFDYTSTGTAGANEWMQIEKVQLEVGSVATQFTRAGGTIQGELAACQRYYYRFASEGKPYASFSIGGYFESTTKYIGRHQHPVAMRTNPTTLDYANLSIIDTSGTFYAVSAAAIDTNTNTSLGMMANFTVSGATTSRYGSVLINNNTGAYLGVGAEL
jgi:hypothetical protein